jgi:hypothetical protein
MHRQPASFAPPIETDRTHSHVDASLSVQNGSYGDARYVLRARDTRLRVSLTREQKAELARAATLAGVKDFADLVGDGSQVDASAGGVSDPLVSTSSIRT